MQVVYSLIFLLYFKNRVAKTSCLVTFMYCSANLGDFLHVQSNDPVNSLFHAHEIVEPTMDAFTRFSKDLSRLTSFDT